jgi:hypothetical protein
MITVVQRFSYDPEPEEQPEENSVAKSNESQLGQSIRRKKALKSITERFMNYFICAVLAIFSYWISYIGVREFRVYSSDNGSVIYFKILFQTLLTLRSVIAKIADSFMLKLGIILTFMGILALLFKMCYEKFKQKFW